MSVLKRFSLARFGVLLLALLVGGVLSASRAHADRVINRCTIVERPTISHRTKCIGANLSRANLSQANLSHADLRAANLSNGDLRAANLSHADLRAANLRYVDLREANLRNADLGYANLTGANLSGAELTGTSFCHTTMPDGNTNNSGCS